MHKMKPRSINKTIRKNVHALDSVFIYVNNANNVMIKPTAAQKTIY